MTEELLRISDLDLICSSLVTHINNSIYKIPTDFLLLLKVPGIKYSSFTISALIQYNSIQTQDATIHFYVSGEKKSTTTATKPKPTKKYWQMLFPPLPFWVFSNHSVPFTGSCCFLPGGDSCLERAFLKYLKWFSEPEVTFRCKQNKPGGLEHPTGGAAESSECFRTQNYSPLRQEVGILIFKY